MFARKTRLIPFSINAETVFFVALTLAARTRVNRAQSVLMFGNEEVSPGDAVNLQKTRKIPIADVLSSGDQQTAIILTEVVRNADGSPFFESPDQVMECEARDVDALIAEYNRLFPSAPVNPAPAAIEEIAGNSSATG